MELEEWQVDNKGLVNEVKTAVKKAFNSSNNIKGIPIKPPKNA